MRVDDEKTSQHLGGLFQRWAEGDEAALDELVDRLGDRLQRLAARLFEGERASHTLQPTALVNELYRTLRQQRRARFQNVEHFFAVAARMMRRHLVDHARKKAAAKRQAPAPASPPGTGSGPEDLLALHAALERLEAVSPRGARVVELKYFPGFENREVAKMLGVSLATVKNDHRAALAWLRRELGEDTSIV